MSIDDWRARIDDIDCKLVALLNDRARYVIEVGKIKNEVRMNVFDPERERQIISRALEQNRGPLDDQSLRRIFECVIDECRRLERIVP
ncbi:MAG: chorismate mutase [Acidobacteria bacterium]|nr:chorismate mutase [Acidobacteriota bacterium]